MKKSWLVCVFSLLLVVAVTRCLAAENHSPLVVSGGNVFFEVKIDGDIKVPAVVDFSADNSSIHFPLGASNTKIEFGGKFFEVAADSFEDIDPQMPISDQFKITKSGFFVTVGRDILEKIILRIDLVNSTYSVAQVLPEKSDSYIFMSCSESVPKQSENNLSDKRIALTGKLGVFPTRQRADRNIGELVPEPGKLWKSTLVGREVATGLIDFESHRIWIDCGRGTVAVESEEMMPALPILGLTGWLVFKNIEKELVTRTLLDSRLFEERKVFEVFDMDIFEVAEIIEGDSDQKRVALWKRARESLTLSYLEGKIGMRVLCDKVYIYGKIEFKKVSRLGTEDRYKLRPASTRTTMAISCFRFPSEVLR